MKRSACVTVGWPFASVDWVQSYESMIQMTKANTAALVLYWLANVKGPPGTELSKQGEHGGLERKCTMVLWSSCLDPTRLGMAVS